MKKAIALALSALMLFGLCACKGNTAESASFSVPETKEPAPTLSPGAAERTYRSCRFQERNGELYTCMTRTDGVKCLYDLLPEGVGYITRFLVTDAGIYAAIKSEYFTLDPAALYFFPFEGDALLLADELSSDGFFVMTDDALFYPDADGQLCRCDLAGSESKAAVSGSVRLLDSDGGFIYYLKDDGVYRNDSTLGAESRVIDFPSSCVRVEGGQLFDLMHSPTDAAIELRDLNGALLGSVPLDGDADHFLLSGGRLYAPRLREKAVSVIDPETRETLDTIPLAGLEGYCLLWYAAEDVVWYETILNGEIVLCRADKTGVQELGPALVCG